MPHACIGVDVIVGFPGETDEHFLETYNFLNEMDISYLHVFTYSERDNTDAIKLEGIVPITERKKRNKMLRILSAKKLRSFYEKNIGQTRPVMFERANRDGFIFGFTDNYVKVKTVYDPSLIKKMHNIKLSGFDSEGIVTAELFETSEVNV